MNGTWTPKAGRSPLKPVRSLFPADVRKRGADYHRHGAVEILDGDASEVAAEVYGTNVYRVEIAVEAELDQLGFHCDCPHFADGNECKHLWAVLLAAEERGLLGDLTRLKPGAILNLTTEADADAFFDAERAVLAKLMKVAPGLADGPFGLRPRRSGGPKAAKPDWRDHFQRLRAAAALPELAREASGPEQVIYVLSRTLPGGNGPLAVEVCVRKRKRNGAWGRPKPRRVTAEFVRGLGDEADARLLSLLRGGESWRYGFDDRENSAAMYRLPGPAQAMLVERMCGTGRCMWRDSDDDPIDLSWDEGEPYRFELRIDAGGAGRRYALTGELVRGEERVALDEAAALSDGVAIIGRRAAAFDRGDGQPWIDLLSEQGPMRVPVSEERELIEQLMSMPRRPPTRLPEAFEVERVRPEPAPRLTLERPDQIAPHEALAASLSFDYDGRIVDAADRRADIYDGDRRLLIERDPEREASARRLLDELGLLPELAVDDGTGGGLLLLPPGRLGEVVRDLDERGWVIEADGKRFRNGSAFEIEVTSGIDWFDIEGGARFGEQSAALPELLEAARRGSQMVRLGDGSWGVLPERWLKRIGVLGGTGEVDGEGGVRLRRSQIGMLDALLEAMPEARVDERVAAARRRLREFERVAPSGPPGGFDGQLRPYQRDGLGWLEFLRGFGFGGCLADDMGLGKTVQVLALLLGRRAEREAAGDRPVYIEHANGNGNGRAGGNGKARRNGNGAAERVAARQCEPEGVGERRPSLVVAPKSVVFNWHQEAERFTPQLRVLVHTGTERAREAGRFDDYDLVLTTYGTLRRDATMLHGARFDYIVLDEAQAIKNASTATAKAARLLDGEHRLALTGTPVENRLSELWSIFEFLNPGMLGTLPAFQNCFKGEGDADEARRAMLARSLRPFILRRTKDQVAADLPPKHEQELWCDLPPRQRRAYDELRDHYRQSLLAKVEQRGLGRSKMHVLEALLRLRQAACHPGLIDKRRRDEPSAKLDLLMQQLDEVLAEGHKALVFSQFTSLLALVRDRLGRRGVDYEYLDGRTRNRQKKVERFQQDPDCRLFLVSLKAGGTGLNLTAAEYVFLLDPWWNPAVEAQAIDRAHRIGQQRPVFAYRLIARGTVEEKVLELHKHKRSLAEAIINADNGLIGRLTRDDLEHLLG